MTVTTKLPGAGEEQDNVEVPDPVTLGGVKLQVRPLGETELARPTTPSKPLMLVRVTVDVPELPT